MKKSSAISQVPALSIDLIVAGTLYYLLIMLTMAGSPTFAELGYSISSAEVRQQQVAVLGLGVIAWLIYSILSTLLFKKSVGQAMTGLSFSKKDTHPRRFVSIFFSPTLIANSLFLSIDIRQSKVTDLNKLAKFGGYATFPFTYLGMLVYILVFSAILLLSSPSQDPTNTLCGEQFCIVETNNSCGRNLDTIKRQTVEVIGEYGTGTGFIVSPSIVLTNYHVIEEEEYVQIRKDDGSILPVTLYGYNEELDLAALQGQFGNVEHIQFVDPQELSIGTTELYAVGYPGTILRDPGTGLVTVTRGIYSSYLPFPDYGIDLVQTDAPINPGNSGGPLTNSCGQVVGIVTLTDRIDTETLLFKEGLNFAISSTTIVPVLNTINY